MTVSYKRRTRRSSNNNSDNMRVDHFEEELVEGAYVDVLDSSNTWQEAQVDSLSNNECFVHFLFWPEGGRDEWVSLHSNRIAPHKSKTYSKHGVRNSLMAGQQVRFLDIHPACNEWVEGRVVDADDASIHVRFFTSSGESVEERVLRNTRRVCALPHPNQQQQQQHRRQSRDPRRATARGSRSIIGQMQNTINRSLSGRSIAIPCTASRRAQQPNGNNSAGSSQYGDHRHSQEEQKYAESSRYYDNRGGGREGTGGIRLQFSERDEDDGVMDGLMMEERARDIMLEDDPRMTRYHRALEDNGFELVNVMGDGNCLFRTVSHQIYGTERHHMLVRLACVDYMKAEASYFQPFVVGDAAAFQRYLAIKRKDGVWGDDIEIQAMCEIYNRPAQIFAYDHASGFRQLRTFHEGGLASVVPMRLSFYGGGHYDSIVLPDDYRQGLLQEPGRVERKALQRALRRQRRGRQSGNSSGGGASVAGSVAGLMNGLDDMSVGAGGSGGSGSCRSSEETSALSVASSASLLSAQRSGDGESLYPSLTPLPAQLPSSGAAAEAAMLRSTGNEATEQALLDDALQRSRKQYDEGTDVERALKESLVGTLEAEEIEVQQALHQSLLLAQQQQQDGARNGGGVDDVEKALQQSREVAAQHEKELLRQVLAQSVSDSSVGGVAYDVAMGAADENSERGRIAMEKVLELSRIEAVAARGEAGGGAVGDDDDDRQLQMALALSMSGETGEERETTALVDTGVGGGNRGQLHNNSEDNQDEEEDEDDVELLKKAIAESLKNN